MLKLLWPLFLTSCSSSTLHSVVEDDTSPMMRREAHSFQDTVRSEKQQETPLGSLDRTGLKWRWKRPAQKAKNFLKRPAVSRYLYNIGFWHILAFQRLSALQEAVTSTVQGLDPLDPDSLEKPYRSSVDVHLPVTNTHTSTSTTTSTITRGVVFSLPEGVEFGSETSATVEHHTASSTHEPQVVISTDAHSSADDITVGTNLGGEAWHYQERDMHEAVDSAARDGTFHPSQGALDDSSASSSSASDDELGLHHLNLNIAALIQSPKKSPFAVALRASKMVLVVPNRHRSVYTRLWCGYEAYLAQEAGKPIAIAGTSVRHWTWRSLKYMCFAAVPGVILGQYVNSHGWKWFRWFLWLPSLAALLGLNAQDHEYSILVHGFCAPRPKGRRGRAPNGASLAARPFGETRVSNTEGLQSVEQLTTYARADQRRYAECSQPEDAQRIQLEIGQEEKFQEVDDAIQVLLTARMSSPALCHIASLGVDIDQAAYSEITAAVVVLQGMSIMGRFLLLWQLYRSPMDERCFLLKVLSKLVAVLMVALFLLLFIAPELQRGRLKQGQTHLETWVTFGV
eukprot:g12993.t1